MPGVEIVDTSKHMEILYQKHSLRRNITADNKHHKLKSCLSEYLEQK
jgi:hypothetical protein